MELTHKVTGATKKVDDGLSEEELASYRDAGWAVTSAPADSGDAASGSSGSAKGGDQKKAESSSEKGAATETTQDEVDTGHAGLKVDEGATVAETGDNPAPASTTGKSKGTGKK